MCSPNAAALVDDCRCGRHWLIAFVGDKPICVLVPEECSLTRERLVSSGTWYDTQLSSAKACIVESFKMSTNRSAGCPGESIREDIPCHASHRHSLHKLCLGQNRGHALFRRSVQVIKLSRDRMNNPPYIRTGTHICSRFLHSVLPHVAIR
jgi:hypothetical protein